MTTGVRILENDGRVQITASGGQTSLAFDFPIYDESHIRIIRTRSGVDTTLALTTDYTVPSGSVGVEAGGVVTLNSGATAGDIYTLLLDVPYARTSDFIVAGDFKAETLNLELDLLTQQNQQIVRDAARAAKIPESSTITDLNLPTPQASKLIGWNSLATGMTNYGIADLSSSTVTAFAQTLLDDSDAATMRATLGISGGTVNNFSATTAPTVNEDSGDGYVVGSEWIDVTNDRIYICVDNALGAAIWKYQVDTNSTQSITGKTVNGVVLTAAGSASKFLNEAGAYTNIITRATEQATTSGTTIDFSSIPAAVKRITVIFDGVSFSGTTDSFIVQLGDSGGLETTSYDSGSAKIGGSAYVTTATNGFVIARNAAVTYRGMMTIVNISGNDWVSNHVFRNATDGYPIQGAGTKSLSGTLDRLRITRTGTTDSFNAGSINIMYEL